MYEIQSFEEHYRDIEANWEGAPLSEKLKYIRELEGIEMRVMIIQSVPATKLLRTARQLREHILGTILPSQHKRDIDERRTDNKLPGESL